jgi:hypothetical protein
MRAASANALRSRTLYRDGETRELLTRAWEQTCNRNLVAKVLDGRADEITCPCVILPAAHPCDQCSAHARTPRVARRPRAQAAAGRAADAWLPAIRRAAAGAVEAADGLQG